MSDALDPKDPDVSETYEIDWRDELILQPARRREFALGEVVESNLGSGWYYECTTAGMTDRNYPNWPRSEGETILDGSIVWTCRHPSSASVPSVQGAVWTVPTGLSLVNQAEQGTITQVTLSGGADGVDYDVLCRMTPTSGEVREQTITIPVRSQ